MLLFRVGIADRTLLFFKATAGYTVLIAVVTNLARLCLWRGAPPLSRSEASSPSNGGVGVGGSLR